MMERRALIELASEAGFGKLLSGDGLPTMWHGSDLKMLERFADLVATAERERICAAIKEEDDHCWTGDYMLDSDDCIAVAKGEWKRPEYAEN